MEAPRLPADSLHLLGISLSPQCRRALRGQLAGCASGIPGWSVASRPVRAPARCWQGGWRRRGDAALTAGGGELRPARVDADADRGGKPGRASLVPGPGGRRAGRGSGRPVSEPGTRTLLPRQGAAQPSGSPKSICRGFRSPRFLPARPRGHMARRGEDSSAAEVPGGKLRLRRAGPPLPPPGPRSHRWGRSALARVSPARGSGRPRPSPRSDAARPRPGAGAPPPCRPPVRLSRRHRPGRLAAGLLRGALGARARAGAARGHDRAGTFPDGSGGGGRSPRQDAAPRAPSPGRGGAGPAPALTPLPAALGALRPAPATPLGAEVGLPAHSAEGGTEAAHAQLRLGEPRPCGPEGPQPLSTELAVRDVGCRGGERKGAAEHWPLSGLLRRPLGSRAVAEWTCT